MMEVFNCIILYITLTQKWLRLMYVINFIGGGEDAETKLGITWLEGVGGGVRQVGEHETNRSMLIAQADFK